MKQHLKTLFLGGTLGVGSFGMVVALAQTSGSTANSQTQAPLGGSVKVLQDEHGEGAEAAAYSKLAKVTLEQAVKVAQNSLSVTASPSSAQLGNENGSLVWEVVIGQQSVAVDAGTARVLQTEQRAANEVADNGEGYDEGEQNDRKASDQQGNERQVSQGEQNEGGTEDGD